MTPKVYSLFDVPPDPGIDCSEGVGADQSFKDECDINVIMERAARGAEVIDPMVVGDRVGDYMDLSNAPQDFLQAQLIVKDAESRFNELPARIRNRFDNDPLELLKFVADDKNKDEAITLGLIEKPPVVPPVPAPAAPVVPPPTAA